MTKVTFWYRTKGLLGFEAQGHTDYAQHGEDIVCAAISALTQGTVIGLDEVVCVCTEVVRNDDEGYLKCMLPDGLDNETWSKTQILLQTLLKSLESIEDEYPNYLSIEEVQPS